MAATAHASVVSLMNTMDQIQSHPSLSTCFDILQFGSLRQNVDLFLDFVENYSDADSNEAEDLVRRIADSAHEAEDKIEVEAADRMRSGSTRKSLNFLFVLQRMIEDMNSIKEKVIKVKQEIGFITNSMPPPLPPPPPPSLAAPIATKKTKMVGFEGYMARLLDKLTSSNSERQILPIVGMGGIGKTTLATNAYENSLMLDHFDVCAWVTVSQDYNATQILSQALACLGGFKSRNDRCNDEVGEKLRKTLFGRRYLIVLDDVWSVKAWENVQFSFPDNKNGSRIVVTTRQQEVVDYFASSAIALDLLDEKNSWELFCDKTFGEEGCPPKLELAGRKIVEKCNGLPLAISVIGGLLGKSPREQEYWEKIAQDKSLVLEGSSEGNQVSSILYLSYKNLPVWLKSCFLYLGLFPEDQHIDVSQLIQFLVAEGYIKANRKQSLEEVAESYVRELVDRNLLVGVLSLNKVLYTCYLHDLVRELCISIAEKENFYCVQRSTDGLSHYIVDERTARSYHAEKNYIPPSGTPSVITPKIVYGQREAPFKSRLLRVWVGIEGQNDPFLELNLRYLCHNPRSYSLPIRWSLSLCWSLQTLKFSNLGTLPSEIWKMPQLRHIEDSCGMYLPDPPKGNSAIVLNNLLTLKTVYKLNFTEELCRRIPNIKHLEIEYKFNEVDGWSWCFNLHNVVCLNKLETLRYSCEGMEYAMNIEPNLTLPSSLRELTLSGCSFWWSGMAMLASLPHLQILELQDGEVVGGLWSCVKDKFRSLKNLKITGYNDLIKWMAESFNFPVLETLRLGNLSKLQEIPTGIGEIDTLESIYLIDCSESVTVSAMKILEEQESLGNESLHLELDFCYETDVEVWRGKIQEMGFTCQHIHISSQKLLDFSLLH